MRLVKSFNSLGNCCCNCEDCCNGAYPSEYDVEFAFADGPGAYGCETCDSDFSGVFTLAKLADNCTWRYVQDAGTTGSDPFTFRHLPLFYCQLPYGPWYLNRREIVLRVNCVSATEYRVYLTYRAELWRTTVNPTPWFGGPAYIEQAMFNVWVWEETVPHASFACDGVDNYELPYSFRQLVTGPAFVCNQVESTMQPAFLTAVP